MNIRLIGITQCLLESSGDPAALIEYAGRVCYRSAAGKRAEFIRARIKSGHESILEHASATFDVRGISRACSHQLVRHRIASYSQESQRYVDMSNADFVVPPSYNAEAMVVWNEFIEEVRNTYSKLIKLGIKKEDARFVLPNAVTTNIVVTMNFRELKHFFEVRISPEAQWEIREVAKTMLSLLIPYAPEVFALVDEQLRDKYPQLFV